MSKTLSKLSQDLMQDEGKVHLIYAFNGTGKTRLSNEFNKLVQSSTSIDENRKIIYYNRLFMIFSYIFCYSQYISI